MDMPQVYRPVPRRTFDITPASSESSLASSPVIEPMDPGRLANEKWPPEKWPVERPSTPMSRTRSFLNLTGSTLLGIYSKATSDGPGESISTPWGTGAQTPSGRSSMVGEELRTDLLAAKLNSDAQRLRMALKKRRKGWKNYYMPLITQTSMLFLFGIAFGMLVTHLQRTQQIAPLPVPKTARTSWYYQVAWGLLGVVIGNALPKIDELLVDEDAIVEAEMDFQKAHLNRSRSSATKFEKDLDRRSLGVSDTGPLWQATVRSIGAFIGIAFAVRKVPWQSTAQVSATLAIANPVLWYLIDRSKSGFALSAVVGVVGTFLLLLVNPGFVPVPAIHHDQVADQVGVVAWLASILFCTSLCFGAVGRKLSL